MTFKTKGAESENEGESLGSSESIPLIPIDVHECYDNEENGTEEDKDDGQCFIDENIPNYHQDQRGDFTHLDPRDVIFYIRIILMTSWASMVVSLLLGVASLVLSETCNSPAAFGFAIDCFIDVVSSAVVVWRFSCCHGSLTENESEKITLILLGALFLTSGVAVMVGVVPDILTAIHFLEFSQMTHKEEALEDYVEEIDACEDKWALMISIVSICCFTMVAVTLTYVGWRLKCKSIESDGFIAITTVITSITWLISMTTMKYFPSLWYLEDVVGVLIATFCIFYGIWLISELLSLITNGRKPNGMRR